MEPRDQSHDDSFLINLFAQKYPSVKKNYL
jgi:hypothetical protein